MDVELFDYSLPKEHIAQKPHIPQDECRLMVCDKNHNKIEHKIFKDIIHFLDKGDLLVLNDTKVIPARLFAKKETGGKIEVFLLEELEKNRFLSLTKGKIKDSTAVVFKNNIRAIITKTCDDKRIVQFLTKTDIKEKLYDIGEVPLPPYISRDYKNYNKKEDFQNYQTVYAKKDGAVAAPTAGLHFTEELIKLIKKKGVNIAYITLHVGIGTFRPIKTKTVGEHKMHKEYYEISQDTADIINETKNKKQRIIAVGTTVIRALESSADKDGYVKKMQSKTDIFIYPGYRYKVIDAMITNFHLPKSTLLMLVSAFYSRERILECYQNAIESNYRFFSFGDAMFIY